MWDTHKGTNVSIFKKRKCVPTLDTDFQIKKNLEWLSDLICIFHLYKVQLKDKEKYIKTIKCTETRNVLLHMYTLREKFVFPHKLYYNFAKSAE